jgi:hypothetical protein
VWMIDGDLPAVRIMKVVSECGESSERRVKISPLTGESRLGGGFTALWRCQGPGKRDKRNFGWWAWLVLPRTELGPAGIVLSILVATKHGSHNDISDTPQYTTVISRSTRHMDRKVGVYLDVGVYLVNFGLQDSELDRSYV